MNRIFVLSLSLSVVILAGCGPSGPAIGQVSGTITLDGQPVEEAMVFFEPVTGGRSSTAMTDADGKYVLNYVGTEKGALVGEHVVKVTKVRPAIYDDSGKVTTPGVPELFPISANTESTLKATVNKGKNTIDFPITSK